MLIDKLKKNFDKSNDKEAEIKAKIESHKEKITEKLITASSAGYTSIEYWFNPTEKEPVTYALLGWLSRENLKVSISDSIFGNMVYTISGWD